MAKFQVTWGEEKTASSGSKYFRADLKDVDGKEYKGVAIFNSFTDYAKVQPGGEVEGKIVEKDYKGQPSYTLENLAPLQSGYRAGGGNMAKVMEKKAEQIATAQGNKELGIMTSSTIRMAVDIAIAEVSGMPLDEGLFKSRVKHWRDFLIAEWSNVKEAPPFN